MLDRILNINPQEKYKSGLKIPSGHNYVVTRHDGNRHHSKDSALFSPLAKLMSKINWTILSMEYISKDKISINFLVNDLEFSTVVDFKEMYKALYHEFLIKRKYKKTGKNYEAETLIKTEKYKIDILDQPLPIETNYLSNLFERIQELNVRNELIVSESPILNEFTEGIESQINEELNYILKVLYTFISTKSKSRVKNNFILKTTKNIPIIMQKVAIIYAE